MHVWPAPRPADGIAVCGFVTRSTTFGRWSEWRHSAGCERAADKGEPRPCGRD